MKPNVANQRHRCRHWHECWMALVLVSECHSWHSYRWTVPYLRTEHYQQTVDSRTQMVTMGLHNIAQLMSVAMILEDLAPKICHTTTKQVKTHLITSHYFQFHRGSYTINWTKTKIQASSDINNVLSTVTILNNKADMADSFVYLVSCVMPVVEMSKRDQTGMHLHESLGIWGYCVSRSTKIHFMQFISSLCSCIWRHPRGARIHLINVFFLRNKFIWLV